MLEPRDVGRIERITEVESDGSYRGVDLNPGPYRVIESGTRTGRIAENVTEVVEQRSRKESPREETSAPDWRSTGHFLLRERGVHWDRVLRES